MAYIIFKASEVKDNKKFSKQFIPILERWRIL
jgi:hypothetical protein